MSNNKSHVDIVLSEFDVYIHEFEYEVLRGRSISPEDVELIRKRMQTRFETLLENLNECSSNYPPLRKELKTR
jgi:hypothetical protein